MQQGAARAPKAQSLTQTAARKAFSSRRTAQTKGLPAQATGRGIQVNGRCQLGPRAVIDDGFTRQPLQQAAAHPQRHMLGLGHLAGVGGITLGGRGRGKQHMGLGLHQGGYAQIVTAYQAAGRMQQTAVAGLGQGSCGQGRARQRPFRVKG